MSISLRFFLFAPDGLLRLSGRCLSDLVDGTEAMPRFAGKKLRLAQVVVQIENRKPIQITKAYGTYLDFDDHGKADKGFAEASVAAINFVDSSHTFETKRNAKVVSLEPLLERKRYNEQYRWAPSKEELDLISQAIFDIRA